MIRNLAKCLCLAMTALAASWAYADAVSTARLGSLHPKNGVVVTNVDFTTSNTQLVETIEATAPTPDLSPYLRKGEAIPTTGGVYTAMVNLHFNRLSVGVWPSGYRPIDVSGGSGAAFTFGDGVQARRSNTMALGTAALNTNEWSFIWNGDANRYYIPSYPSMSNPYATRYNGGFHINPSVRSGMVNPLQNFWIGDTNLNDWISILAPTPTWDTLSGKPTFATVATSGAYSDLTGKPTLAAVATSGAYSDLSGKPNFDAISTNLVKTVISNSLYNLTYDETLRVTWRKTAEGGAFYERCYTNINMIGVQP